MNNISDGQAEDEAKKKAEAKTALILGIVFSAMIVAMIVGMLVFDIYAENKMKEQSHVAEPSDAADR